MSLNIRPADRADVQALGRITFDAFTTISKQHGFPPDFPAVEAGIGLWDHLLNSPSVYPIVAEQDDRVVGGNALWESSAVGGVGPVVVDPNAQNASVGRRMMERVLARAAERRLPSVRLVQAAVHNRSLSLYTKLGFAVREPLACMIGTPRPQQIAGHTARPAMEKDLDACNELCRRVHGHDRAAELSGAVRQKTATVVESGGRIVGYATSIGFFGHAVGETTEAIKSLILLTPPLTGPGMLVPTRNTELFRWCLESGLRVSQPMNLMSLGLYNEPAGAFMPSILY